MATRSIVVFPDPLGPTTNVGGPAVIFKFTLSRMRTVPTITLACSKTIGIFEPVCIIPPIARPRVAPSRQAH